MDTPTGQLHSDNPSWGLLGTQVILGFVKLAVDTKVSLVDSSSEL